MQKITRNILLTKRTHDRDVEDVHNDDVQRSDDEELYIRQTYILSVTVLYTYIHDIHIDVKQEERIYISDFIS